MFLPFAAGYPERCALARKNTVQAQVVAFVVVEGLEGGEVRRWKMRKKQQRVTHPDVAGGAPESRGFVGFACLGSWGRSHS